MAEKKEKRYVSNNAQLLDEWDWERNDDFNPSTLMLGSGKKVWWICSNGHEYTASPNARTSNKRGCPYCNGHTVLKGFNDLKTLFPQIASEWCYIKNPSTSPDMVFPHSKKSIGGFALLVKQNILLQLQTEQMVVDALNVHFVTILRLPNKRYFFTFPKPIRMQLIGILKFLITKWKSISTFLL